MPVHFSRIPEPRHTSPSPGRDQQTAASKDGKGSRKSGPCWYVSDSRCSVFLSLNTSHQRPWKANRKNPATGKVKSQTPKVEPAEKAKTPKGRARKREVYTRRFVNVAVTGGKRKVR